MYQYVPIGSFWNCPRKTWSLMHWIHKGHTEADLINFLLTVRNRLDTRKMVMIRVNEVCKWFWKWITRKRIPRQLNTETLLPLYKTKNIFLWASFLWHVYINKRTLKSYLLHFTTLEIKFLATKRSYIHLNKLNEYNIYFFGKKKTCVLFFRYKHYELVQGSLEKTPQLNKFKNFR